MEQALIGLALLVILALVAVIVARRRQKGAPPARTKLPYRLRDSLLTPAERSFYGVLCTEADALSLRVFAKVRLLDLFWLEREEEQMVLHRNKIQQKHVDFVLCDADRVAPVVAIELDDRSHDRQDRRDRDDFVNRVFEDAGLPLLHFAAKSGYVAAEVRERLIWALGGATVATDIPAPSTSAPTSESQPPAGDGRVCPKCGSGLVERVRRGSQSHFLACPQFPNCRYTEALAQ